MAAAPSPTGTPQPPATNRPPMTLSPAAYIADGAYIRGTHPVTIGANTLIHPRAYINSTHSPINIGANCTIYEKATIGGPLLSTSSVEPAVPNPTIHLTRNATTSSSSPTTTTTQPDQISTDPSTSTLTSASTYPLSPSQPLPITIHNNVLVSPHTHIQHSTTIHASVLLEPHVTVLPNSTIGANTKICAGVTLPSDSAIPAWTVVLSDGSQRRSRRAPLSQTASTNATGEDGTGAGSTTTAALGVGDTNPANDDTAANDSTAPEIHQTESHRLHYQNKERDSTMFILKQNARMSAHSAQAQAKRQSQIVPSTSTTSGLGSGSNRDSIIR